MKKGSLRAPGFVRPGVSKSHFHRFACLEAKPVRESSWLEAFGSITLGSAVLETNRHVISHGLKADCDAIGLDMWNVLAANDAEKRKLLSNG